MQMMSTEEFSNVLTEMAKEKGKYFNGDVAPQWAYKMLAYASQQDINQGAKIIESVRNLCCTNTFFDWSLWFLSCTVYQMLVVKEMQHDKRSR